MPHYEGKAPDACDTRLDLYISRKLKLLSRSQIKTLNLRALVNGKRRKFSYILKGGEHLQFEWDEIPPLELLPENIQLDVLYEDADCIALNKAQGMVVHPGAGNHSGTLVNALLWRRGFSAGNAGAAVRPYIVHRLDKDTSGVIIAAWTSSALSFLQEQFKTRAVKKTYAAIVNGRPKDGEGLIDTFICRAANNRKLFTVSAAKGKRAVTRYKVIKSWEKNGNEYSLLLLRPKTGRTHQLRVHLRHIGCHIAGDPLYGLSNEKHSLMLHSLMLHSLMLHALSLEITLPCGVQKKIKTKIPERFGALLN